MSRHGLKPHPSGRGARQKTVSITVEIWRELSEEFCRQVEVMNGQAVRCEAPRRVNQAAVRRLAAVLDSAAADYVALHPGLGLDVSNDFDVIL